MNYKISPEKLASIKKHKSIRLKLGVITLTTILFSTLLIICLVAPVSRIGYTANCFAIIGMLLIVFLYHGNYKSDNVISSENVLFRQALMMIMAEMSANTILSILENKKDYVILDYIFMTFIFVILAVGFTVFFRFFLHFYNISEKTKIIIFNIELATLSIYVISIILNLYTHHYFSIDSDGNYFYPDSYYFTYVFYGIWGIVHLILTLFSGLGTKIKLTMLSYLFPVVITIFTDDYLDIDASSSEDIITGYGGLVCLIFVFCNILIQRSEEAVLWKAKQRDLQAAMMVSQIQPHFMYNTLTTIYFLCGEDPETAQEAIDKFSRYLRTNMKTMAATGTVPFTEELEHTKTYLWIEKLRFEERLNVEYDIQFEDFCIPPLTLQPLVENAVKHGIGVLEDGGTIKISTRKEKDKVILSVSDNGVGFDVEHAFPEGEDHIGMNNVKTRLKRYNCKLNITSIIGEGTNAEIVIK